LSLGRKLPIEHIRRDRLLVIAHGRRAETLAGAGSEALSPH
jgi:hypothetical protein